MAKTGTTTGNLKMRSGPGIEFEPPIAFLEPNTPLEILGEEGDWLKVRAAGKEGYVGRKYVNIVEAPAPAGMAKRPAAPVQKGGASKDKTRGSGGLDEE